MKDDIANLTKSFELSSQQVGDAVDPLELAAVFEKEKLSYVLIGGHLISFYTGIARANSRCRFYSWRKGFSKGNEDC